MKKIKHALGGLGGKICNISFSAGFTPLEISNSGRVRKFKENNHRQSKSLTGFTLIELLVVVAIFGMLVSVTFVSFVSARQKQRDVVRRSDLKQVAHALELYASSYQIYPSTGGAWWGACATYGSHGVSGADGWTPSVAPSFIPSLPLDPKQLGNDGCYLYNSNGADYKLLAHLTMERDCPPMPASDSMYDPARSGGQCTVAIYTSGAANW